MSRLAVDAIRIYSLYAAQRGDLFVLAFEANPFTFECLLRNTIENDLAARLMPYCAAIAEKLSLGPLFVHGTEAGTVGNAFGDASSTISWRSASRLAVPSFSISIDDLVDLGAEFPNYLKIDVDSIEDQIIAGAANVFSDIRLRSVMIELHKDPQGGDGRARSMTEQMREYGFPFAQYDAGTENCLFARKS